MVHKSDTHWTSLRDLQAIAKEAQYLNKLPSHQVFSLVLAGTVKRFPEESLVVSEGSHMEEVYLILHGLVTVGLYEHVHPALWLYVSGPGTVVDACALLDPPVSPVSIRALTDVEVLSIPRETFAKVMQREAAVGYEMLQDLCNRLSLINRVTLKEFSQEYPGPSRN